MTSSTHGSIPARVPSTGSARETSRATSRAVPAAASISMRRWSSTRAVTASASSAVARSPSCPSRSVNAQPTTRTTVRQAAASRKYLRRLAATFTWESRDTAYAQTPIAVPHTNTARTAWIGMPVASRNALADGHPRGRNDAAGTGIPAQSP